MNPDCRICEEFRDCRGKCPGVGPDVPNDPDMRRDASGSGRRPSCWQLATNRSGNVDPETGDIVASPLRRSTPFGYDPFSAAALLRRTKGRAETQRDVEREAATETASGAADGISPDPSAMLCQKGPPGVRVPPRPVRADR